MIENFETTIQETQQPTTETDTSSTKETTESIKPKSKPRRPKKKPTTSEKDSSVLTGIETTLEVKSDETLEEILKGITKLSELITSQTAVVMLFLKEFETYANNATQANMKGIAMLDKMNPLADYQLGMIDDIRDDDDSSDSDDILSIKEDIESIKRMINEISENVTKQQKTLNFHTRIINDFCRDLSREKPVCGYDNDFIDYSKKRKKKKNKFMI
jgi:hypothetical protein